MTEQRDVNYVIDENLSPLIVELLEACEFTAYCAPSETDDDVILTELKTKLPIHSVLLTGDHTMRKRFREQIKDSQVSMAWVHANELGLSSHLFLAIGFVMSKHEALTSAPSPAYFDVHLGSSDMKISVDITRGPL